MTTAGTMERIIFRLKFKLSPLLKRNKSDRIMVMSFLNTKMVLKAVAAWRVMVTNKPCCCCS